MPRKTDSPETQIDKIREVVDRALADENGDRQYALEQIDTIVNPA